MIIKHLHQETMKLETVSHRRKENSEDRQHRNSDQVAERFRNKDPHPCSFTNKLVSFLKG